MLTAEQSEYKSVYFNDGGWIQFNGLETNSYLNNNFTLQMWVSGAEQYSNDSKTLLSIIDDNNEQVLFGLFINTTINIVKTKLITNFNKSKFHYGKNTTN